MLQETPMGAHYEQRCGDRRRAEWRQGRGGETQRDTDTDYGSDTDTDNGYDYDTEGSVGTEREMPCGWRAAVGPALVRVEVY